MVDSSPWNGATEVPEDVMAEGAIAPIQLEKSREYEVSGGLIELRP